MGQEAGVKSCWKTMAGCAFSRPLNLSRPLLPNIFGSGGRAGGGVNRPAICWGEQGLQGQAAQHTPLPAQPGQLIN